MKVFDIHAHIYPDSIAPRAVENLSSAYEGIDVLCDGRLDTLLQQAATAGIARIAAHSVATAAHQVDSINRFILSAAQAHPDSVLPFAALHPDTPDLPQAVDTLIASGFRGVKLHPELQGFRVDEPRALRLFDALAGRLPVLLHCGDYRCDHSSPERIKTALKSVPGIALVCAHLGGWTYWERAADALAGQNLWVDSSSSLYALDADTAVNIIRHYGANRVIFGTDYPVWNPVEELSRFLALPLTGEEQEKILWNNHLKLFGDNI